jgi:hypothetical protein
MRASTEDAREASRSAEATMSRRCEPAAMIEANGLTKSLGGRVVVDDVPFRCETGTETGPAIRPASSRQPLAAK